jgi:CTP-dependent riboflavin kinase
MKSYACNHALKKGLALGKDMRLTGTVSSGLGRAHIFMAQPHYQEQFKNLLGGTAWPGTLNLGIQGQDLVNYIALRKKSGIDTLDASSEDRSAAALIDVSMHEAHRIRGFLRDGVSFGGATAFSAILESGDATVECALLIPDLTRHTDVVEVIACAFLREKMSLQDDDIIQILVK